MAENQMIEQFNRNAAHLAASDQDLPMLIKAIGDNVNLDAQDAIGYTPLHFGALHRNVEVISTLLQAGANPNIRDTKGNSPLWVAVLGGAHPKQVSCIKLLLEMNADPDSINHAGKTPREMAIRIGHGLEAPFK